MKKFWYPIAASVLTLVIAMLCVACTPQEANTESWYQKGPLYVWDGSTWVQVTGGGGDGGGTSWGLITGTISDQTDLQNELNARELIANKGAAGGYAGLDASQRLGNSVYTSGSWLLQPSGDTDDYFTFATVNNIPTIYGTGSYVRIGDASTSAAGLTFEDDLLVTGKLEVNGTVSLLSGLTSYSSLGLLVRDDTQIGLGAANPDARFMYLTQDANANSLILALPNASGPNVPVFIIGNQSVYNDLGLFDTVTQPISSVVEKNGKYTSSTTGNALAAGATLTKAGSFTNSVVGDIVRITAGTHVTAGWYWTTTVTDADTIVLDRNFISDVGHSDIVFVAYHSFTMLSAEGICTRITDGAPSDASVEIDRDGWQILDVSQPNGRLYWRANNGWHYVDATGGLSMTKEERVDAYGHTFKVGDEVRLVVDKINEDGSFHAIPTYGGQTTELPKRHMPITQVLTFVLIGLLTVGLAVTNLRRKRAR